MKKILLAPLLFFVALVLSGCATTMTCVPMSPKALEEGNRDAIPYYLPKPYLLVTKNVNAIGDKKMKETSKVTEREKTTETTKESSEPVSVSGSIYSYQIVYLPDLRYKYGLKFSKGSGTYESSFKLEDGWRFTGLTSKGDAKIPETILATGNLVKELTAAGAALVKAVWTPPVPPPADKEQPATIWVYEIRDDMTLNLLKVWDPDCKEK